MNNAKPCARCKETLPLDVFGKRAAAPDGLHPYCKPCVSEYCKKRYAKNADAVKAAAKEYRERNAEDVRRRDRERYEADKEKYQARIAAYYSKNRERLLQSSRERRNLLDKDMERAYKRAYRSSNKVLRREWDHRRRVRERNSMVVPLTRTMIAAKVAYWGGKCWVCRVPYEAIDHVKPIAKGGPHILANLRPICGPCNSKKHSIWPYVPHNQFSKEG